MSSSPYYPPPKFYFSVNILGTGTALAALTSIDSSFHDVSGIEVSYETEEVAEGGENRFVHRLPKQAKSPPLVLKRGVVTMDSVLGEWVGDTLNSNLTSSIVTQNLLVMLLGPDSIPLIAWAFSNAWPLKWKTDSLNSTENEVLFETLEFSYNFFIRTTIASPLSAGASLMKLENSLS